MRRRRRMRTGGMVDRNRNGNGKARGLILGGG